MKHTAAVTRLEALSQCVELQRGGTKVSVIGSLKLVKKKKKGRSLKDWRL